MNEEPTKNLMYNFIRNRQPASYNTSLTFEEVSNEFKLPYTTLFALIQERKIAFNKEKHSINAVDVLGWLESQWKFSETAKSRWAKVLFTEGVASIPNVFSDDDITNLLKLFKKEVIYRQKNPNDNTMFDKDINGVDFLERQRFVFNKPYNSILSHPVFTEIAVELFGTDRWIPTQLAILHKPPGSLGMYPHRDPLWFKPEERRRSSIRIFCQISLTPPSEGDRGLYYIPKSHLNDSNGKLMECPEVYNSLCVYPKLTVNDLFILNNGTIHGVETNNDEKTSYRLYIGMSPEEEVTRTVVLDGVDYRKKGLEALSSAKESEGREKKTNLKPRKKRVTA